MAASSSAGSKPPYLLYDPAVPSAALIDDNRIDAFTERHKFSLAAEPIYEMAQGLVQEARRRGALSGVIVKLDGGIPPRHLLAASRQLMSAGRRVYYFWPAEGAIEVVDDLRLKSIRRHWFAYQIYRRLFSKQRQSDTQANAAGTMSSSASVLSLMKTDAGTVSKELVRWQEVLDQVVTGGHRIESATAAIKQAAASGTASVLLASLDECGHAMEQTQALLAQARLAVNRIGFCFDDLAKSAETPAMAGLIDPPHLRGIRQSVTGAGTQLHDVEAAYRDNLPGILNTATMVRGATQDADDDKKAAELDGVIHDNVGVVINLATALAGYCQQVKATAEVVVPQVTSARDLVVERLTAYETQATAPPASIAAPTVQPAPDEVLTRTRLQLGLLRDRIAPIPFALQHTPTMDNPLPGTGLYLRTDYWAPIVSGGSYGHTCYQARALARTTENFACITSNKFPLLDDLGLRQVVVRPDGFDSTELSLVRANDYYYQALKPAVELIRPAYIFERACLGNFVGARLSSELGIPYVVEYNGSEISMKRSFDTGPYQLEDIYLEAEKVTFDQASIISVISDAVRDDVIKRGIDPAKIVVNWNAVDLAAYGPLPAAKRLALRTELGFSPGHRVICFIGTFGGWHGIEVLAEALPRIAKANANARFLLIGDGNFKHLVREVIEKHGLQSIVTDCGRVPQARGAELMAAADMFVSPHSSHMVDSRFFGSPTKLFEYMAYGVGIVASDLEQIGEIMRPSLTPADLGAGAPSVGDARGILCKPGSVDEFVTAVVRLTERPDLSLALGQNARRAAERHFTWDGHVAKLWQFIARREGVTERLTASSASGSRVTVH